jgi:hypothetical protein
MRAGVPREARSLPISPCRTAGTLAKSWRRMSSWVVHLWGLVGFDAERKALLGWQKACSECLGLPMK